jgi:hypothetical protein
MKSVICCTIDFMKAKNFFFIIILFVLINACGTNNNEKKSETQVATKDSVVAEERLPSLEKEFADTLNVKPVKDSVLLKFNFKKGKTYNYTMSFDVKQKKGDQTRGTNMKWNYDMQVVDVKNDLKTIKTTYKRIDMSVNMGNDQKMEFSSEKEVDVADFMQLPSKMFSIIKGKSFTMQVNEKGEIISVTGFDKIGEAVVGEMNVPEEMKPMMRQNFQKQFNDDAVKQMFSQSFEIFPNKYVKVGDSWKKNSSVPALKQDIATIYTVKNIKGNRVFINGESKLKSSDGKTSGMQTSKLIIDSKTGLMIDGVFDQKSSDGQMNSKSRITGKEF